MTPSSKDNGNSGSMFAKVDTLCKDVEDLEVKTKEVDNKVKVVDNKVEEVEKIQNQHTLQLHVIAEQVKQLQDNGIRLENVVMSENRETRLTITQTNGELHKLINGLIGYKAGENELTHTATMAISERKHTVRMKTIETIAKVIGILCGSGGIVYMIFFK